MAVEGWEQKSLEDLAYYYNGCAFKPEDWVKTGLPIIRIANINNPKAEIDYYDGNDIPETNLIDDGDIIFSWSATLAAMRWNRGPAILNQHIFKVVEKPGVYKGYLLQLIKNSIDALADHSHGSTMKHIKKGVLKVFKVDVPPLSEQKKIAEILESVDDAIAKTEAVIVQTERVKQGLLQQLLTCGIGHTKFKQSSIGEIPESWKADRLDKFFILQRGFDITEKNRKEGDVPVISSSGLAYFHSKAMVAGPGVITGRKGKLGNVYYIKEDYWPHDTTLWVKDFKGNYPKYIYWFIRTLNLNQYDAATSVPTLNRNNVHCLIVRFPPIEEQIRITECLDKIEDITSLKVKYLEKLIGVKKGLMSELLSGRVRVNVDAIPATKTEVAA